MRASFRLDELLPVDDTIEQERENLSAPSVKLMRTVAAAIREDLGKVKDVLDIYVRRGGQPAELASQVSMLRKIGDTLGVLGLGELRAAGASKRPGGSKPWPPARRLRITPRWWTSPRRSSMSKTSWTRADRADRAEGAGGAIRRSPIDMDFQQVQSAVLRECSRQPGARQGDDCRRTSAGTLDVGALDTWQGLMRGIKAGLMMLGKTRAVEIVDGIRSEPQARDAAGRLGRAAATISTAWPTRS